MGGAMARRKTAKESVEKEPAKAALKAEPARAPWGSAAGDWIGEDASMVLRPRVMSASGLSISAQAGPTHYCVPRQARGVYESVEVGMPSERVEELMPWAEEPGSPTSTVYGRAPIAVVAAALFARGGRADEQRDWTPQVMGRFSIDLPQPPAGEEAPEPRRFDMELGAQALEQAAWAWIQEAVLGSPFAERSARLELWRGGEKVMPWADCQSSIASIDPRRLAQNDVRGWARAMWSRLEEAWQLRQASQEPPKRARRGSL